jgi:hypothetical protein
MLLGAITTRPPNRHWTEGSRRLGQLMNLKKDSQVHGDSTVSLAGSHTGAELSELIATRKERRLGADYRN